MPGEDQRQRENLRERRECVRGVEEGTGCGEVGEREGVSLWVGEDEDEGVGEFEGRTSICVDDMLDEWTERKEGG
jgi:hypothetical protein